MRDDLVDLHYKLGGSTGSLGLRVGMHSGPIVAGVLRGAKSRFQLFGDTMNTAARMESNGLPNRIHVSEATATLLRELGKGHWVEARKDKISAKGKGVMQTYWIDTRTHSLPSETTIEDIESRINTDTNEEDSRPTANNADDIEALQNRLQERFCKK